MSMYILASSILAFLVYALPAICSGGSLYPPGLLPLINRANLLLSTGQFNEAARVYGQAIDQSPADYVLYYKRATAYYSLSRHYQALDDFEQVLKLTSGTFDGAHLMKARIWLKEGNFEDARTAVESFRNAKGKLDAGSADVVELEKELAEGEMLEEKMEKQRRAQLWNICVETSSDALRIASHSIDIRSVRAECALGAGDVESTVGDLMRLSNLLPPSTTLLTTIFRLSYFLLPPAPASMSALKQCLHYDPDSKACLALHRLYKSFDKSFIQLAELEAAEEWSSVVSFLVGPRPEGGRNVKGEFLKRFEEALAEHTTRENLLPPQLSQRSDVPEIPLPDFSKKSYLRQTLVRSLCKAYTQVEKKAQMKRWCVELLSMEGCQEDIDGLVGKGEAHLVDEEWEEGVRVLEHAFEQSGKSNGHILRRLKRAQKLLKQSRRKDYYQILGVPRDADERTIKKAFHRAAKTAHPDKGGSEAKMAAINEAYEVLIKPELRERFDNGEDPNDPTAGQQDSYQPFGSGGQYHFASFFKGGFPRGAFRQGGFDFHFTHG